MTAAPDVLYNNRVHFGAADSFASIIESVQLYKMQILYNTGERKSVERMIDMLLSVDIGNSSISFGVFSATNADSLGVEMVHSFQIATRAITADEYAILICDFLRIKHLVPSSSSVFYDPSYTDMGYPSIDCAAVASVVPSLTETLCNAVAMITGEKPFIIASGIRTGLGIRIKNPTQLGADIVANAVCAAAMFEAPILVLDVGTATTLTVIDEDRNILGTVIMPGLAVSLAALSGSAAQLSEIPLTAPGTLIGRDSAESVQSGVVNGHAIMIDGFIRRIREQYPELTTNKKFSLVSTGGLSSVVLPHMRNKFTDYPTLTLSGIAHLYFRNHA